jgi:hypothetical protein
MLLHIWEFPGSNLGLVDVYSDVPQGSAQSLNTKSRPIS